MKPSASTEKNLIFPNLEKVALHLQGELKTKKTALLYAYNGVGKTRLSMVFKDIGRKGDARDTLYFNAFTEDLFHWNNDLEGDEDRRLLLNKNSRFFDGLFEWEMDIRIRQLLQRYADFDFRIDTQTPEWAVRFSRQTNGELIDNIKISRGEENIFIWCFFLAVVELTMDKDINAYEWVKYLYIDDPISSLDEHNAITVAHHLAQLLKHADNKLKTVISTHHPLFFNVLSNELKKALKYVLEKGPANGTHQLRRETEHTPFFTTSPPWSNCIRRRRRTGCSLITSTCCARFLKRPRVFMVTRNSRFASKKQTTTRMECCTHGLSIS